MSTPQEQNLNDQTMMIWNMERKLNSWWFAKHNRKVDSYSQLSTNHYWDWLVYIDVSFVFD
jgi:hypothetical protein